MFIDIFGALIVLLTLLARRKLQGDALQARMLRALMLCCLAVFAIDVPGLLLDGRVFLGARTLLWALDMGYWLLHILYCYLWLCFADYWCFRSKARLMRLAWLYAVPLLIEAGLLFSSPWTGWLFVLGEGNAYAPGIRYQLCLIPFYVYVLASMLIAGFGLAKSRDTAHKRRCLSLLAYMLLPVMGVVMELFDYGVSWVFPMIALSLLMVNLNLQQQDILDERLATAQAAKTAAQMSAEMANSRMMIMLSQIQPHFLYNALCVIQDLCHGKAPEAEQATIAFSRFLRGNLDSLNASRPVPFSQELSHTQYYLTLEQLRFGERLRIEYDIQTKMFSMPAMTLQPIVENAVRYGVMQREAGGTVRIASAETEKEYTIIIEDDGVGFDPYQKHEDGRTHIGISNVRQRLREMCGGDLEIVSMRGAGTVAAITLPKEATQE